eukprot:jgi/Orpsp1_1/1180644/evm.model.c7180000074198.1
MKFSSSILLAIVLLCGCISNATAKECDTIKAYLKNNKITKDYDTVCNKSGDLEALIIRFNTVTFDNLNFIISYYKNLRKIELPGTSINGNIPDSIGELSKLEYLNLRGAGITGSIPSSINKLTNLKYLYLHNNKISGPIPDMSNLTNLVE